MLNVGLIPSQYVAVAILYVMIGMMEMILVYLPLIWLMRDADPNAVIWMVRDTYPNCYDLIGGSNIPLDTLT